MSDICRRCGKMKSGYHAARRCSCPPERQRRTMSYNDRVASLTEDGVRRVAEEIMGVSDVQVRSEDLNLRRGHPATFNPDADEDA